jgi:hypothetical protein
MGLWIGDHDRRSGRLRAVGVIVLFAFSGCRRSDAEWVADLTAADPLDRELAVLAFGEGEVRLDSTSAALLVERLSDPNPAISHSASQALRLREHSDVLVFAATATAAVGALPTSRLADESIRSEALTLIAECGSVEGARALLERWDATPPHAKQMVLATLCRMDRSSIAAVERLNAAGTAVDEEVVHSILLCALVGEDPETAARAIEFTTRIENGTAVRARAIEYLARTPNAITLPGLERLLPESQAALTDAIRRLIEIAGSGQKPGDFVEVARAAGPESVMLLVRAIATGEPENRAGAARILVLVDSSAARLHAVFNLSDDDEFQLELATRLCVRATAFDLPYLVAQGRSADPTVRAKVVVALEQLAKRHTAAKQFLLLMATDSDSRVVTRALLALRRLNDR